MYVYICYGRVAQHLLGDAFGLCVGNLFWNVVTRHVVVLPRLPCTFETSANPPWFFSTIGGKRAENKPKQKPTKKHESGSLGDVSDDVNGIIQTRMQIPPNTQKCMARTFRFFRCAHKAHFCHAVIRHLSLSRACAHFAHARFDDIFVSGTCS